MLREIDDPTAFTLAVSSAGPSLVFFTATWCGPCKTMYPVVEKIQSDHPDMDVFKVDVDEASSVAEKYKVSSMPTFIMFKKTVEIGRVVGANQDGLRKMVKNNYSAQPPVKDMERMSMNSQYDPYTSRGRGGFNNPYEYSNKNETVNQNGIDMIESSQGSFNPQESAPPQSSKYYTENPDKQHAKLAIDPNYYNSKNGKSGRSSGPSGKSNQDYQNVNREYGFNNSDQYSSNGQQNQGQYSQYGSSSQHDQSQPSSGQYDQPSSGQYGQPSSGQYGQANSGQYGQANSGQYGQPSSGQYGQPSSGQYGQPSSGQYGQPSSGQYGQPSSGQYGQPSSGQYNQGYGPSSPNQYNQGYGPSSPGQYNQGHGQYNSGNPVSPNQTRQNQFSPNSNQTGPKPYFPTQYSPNPDKIQSPQTKNSPSPPENKAEVQKPKLVPIRKTQMSPKITVDTKVIPHDKV